MLVRLPGFALVLRERCSSGFAFGGLETWDLWCLHAKIQTVSNSLIQRLKETNAADVLNQVNKGAKIYYGSRSCFLSSTPVKDCISLGNFSFQLHHNSSFYRLLNINYFIQVNAKEYLPRNNILTTEHDASEASDGLFHHFGYTSSISQDLFETGGVETGRWWGHAMNVRTLTAVL